MFYNHWIALVYEIVAYAGFAINVAWGIAAPADVYGFGFVEQIVLSLLMLNGLSLVRVCSLGDSSDSSGAFLSHWSTNRESSRWKSGRTRARTVSE
ncbi:hypothetical protein DFJ73DRAFT_871897 [Zopfochytrium polystomum]|nr:hypothetical protein DFJ73DRAFT_871897 [Zopfochytrium polystomum]